ncbi:MAG TPA: 4-hydroxy-tetrahydrodipicolinate reductase [Drouetiella sp.]
MVSHVGLSMSLKVSIAGATGWTGKAVAQAVAVAEDMTLASAVSRSTAGQVLRGIGVASDIKMCGSVAEALATPVDVFVDYAGSSTVREHVMMALQKGVNVVVGSSGLTGDDFVEIERLAKEKNLGVIACGNFSITAGLAKHFSLLAAKFLPSWEIIDYASATKLDAPSGTTRELAEAMDKVRQNKLGRPVSEVTGDRTARGAQISGTPVHSLRLPGYSLSFETQFGLPDERLTIRHDAGSSAAPYVDGTLLAIRKASETKGVIRGLDQLMFG